MAWYEDQTVVHEGFDTSAMLNMIQAWLPITFRTSATHPIGEQKLFVELTPSQLALLGEPDKAALVAKYTLQALNRDTLRQSLDTNADMEMAFFRSVLGGGLKFALPSG
jgi:hypothetical protein